MTAAEQEANEPSLPTPTPTQEPKAEEWLTDVIDQWSRNAFRRSLERRHAAESTRLVRTSSS
jgi:hypothetical protein